MLNLERTGWTELSFKMPYVARGHRTVHLNGKIYVFGGVTDNGWTDNCYKLNKELKSVFDDFLNKYKQREDAEESINKFCSVRGLEIEKLFHFLF